MKLDLARIHGIVVPVITPLNKDESIDENALLKIADYLISGGVHGIFVNSTTGEGVCLTNEEGRKVLQIVVQRVNKKVPVYANVSATSVKLALNNIKQVEDLGADIAVAHPPYFYPPNSQEELYTYYESLLNESKMPVMIYNIPFTTQAPIAIDTIERLLHFENLIGIKDSSVDYVFLLNLIKLKEQRPDFKIFIGKSHLWTAGILSGADGGLDGISNVIPGLCVKLYDKIKSGSDHVFDFQKEIDEIWRIYECRSFLGGVKAAMSLLGLCEAYTSKPILQASEEEVKNIKNILVEKEILKI
ncbi:dihydrodipicolinate synthase family protein [candidate division KSB1 bacterium]|nr:dihydrodipicolinate synthase family protein [candidate division KSB1 bacterium]